MNNKVQPKSPFISTGTEITRPIETDSAPLADKKTLDGTVSDVTAPNTSKAIAFLAKNSENAPLTNEQIVAEATKIAEKWAQQKGIPLALLPKIDIDSKNLLPSIAGAAYTGANDTFYLNKAFLSENLGLLKRLTPHEETHAHHAKLRTRLKLQRPDRYKQIVKDHMKDLVLNGEIGTILSEVKLEEQKEGEKLRKPKECKFIDVPYISPSMRGTVADLLEVFFNNHKEVFIKLDDDNLPKLTDNEKHMVNKLLTESIASDFIAQYDYHSNADKEQNMELAKEQAHSSLVEYFQAQLLRTHILYHGAAIRDEKTLQSLNFPLSPSNIDLSPPGIKEAEASLRGYLSTIEGNLRMQYPPDKSLFATPSPEEVFAYTFGAYEERQAELNSAEFLLLEVKESLGTESSDQLPAENQLKNISAQEANIDLLNLASGYVEITRDINSAPKDINVLKEVNRAKCELVKFKERLGIIEKETEKMSLERSSDKVIIKIGDGITATERVMGADEAKLLIEKKALKEKKIPELETLIKEISSPEKVLDFNGDNEKPNRQLLEDRQKILARMKELVPKCDFMVPLPQLLFNSEADWAKYHSERTAPDKAKQLLGQMLGGVIAKALSGATVVTGLFDRKKD